MLKRILRFFSPPEADKSSISHPETSCLQQTWSPIPCTAGAWKQASKPALQQHVPLTSACSRQPANSEQQEDRCTPGREMRVVFQNESHFTRLNNVCNDRNAAVSTGLKAEMKMKTDNRFQGKNKEKNQKPIKQKTTQTKKKNPPTIQIPTHLCPAILKSINLFV